MSSIENKGKVIYLDNAATTKMSEEVKEAMDPYLEEKFGNASTMYGYGETSRQALEKAVSFVLEHEKRQGKQLPVHWRQNRQKFFLHPVVRSRTTGQ